jgi:hypothetical protein
MCRSSCRTSVIFFRTNTYSENIAGLRRMKNDGLFSEHLVRVYDEVSDNYDYDYSVTRRRPPRERILYVTVYHMSCT